MKSTNFSRFKFIFSVCATVLFFAKANAGIDVSKTHINGIPVYLINTHLGNGLALTANIQAGSRHDEPVRHAGLAHYWEHMVHGGSKKFPGHKTFFNLIGGTGANYNAYTSGTRTFYHAWFHQEAFGEVSSLLGAMLSAPEWDAETAKKEMETVKQEAADYQSRDNRVLEDLPFIELLPEGHPWRMYTVGTGAQLDGLGVADIKQFFFTNYRKESMQIIVAGNFDHLRVNDLLSNLALNFHPANPLTDPEAQGIEVEPPYKTKVFPPLVSDENRESLKMVEIRAAETQKMLTLKFELPPDQNEMALETLVDYLNLTSKGTFVRSLIDDGLATDVSFAGRRINNIHYLEVDFELTENGGDARFSIIETLLKRFNDLKRNGFSEETLAELRRRNVASYSSSLVEPKPVAEYFAKFLDNGYEKPESKAFDFRGLYESVTLKQIKDISAHLDPANMLVGYIGPEVSGDAVDTTFGRSIVRIDDPVKFAQFAEAFRAENPTPFAERVSIEKMELPFSEKPLDSKGHFEGLVETGLPMTDLVFSESHSTTNGAIELSLESRPLSLEEQVATSIFSAAFEQRFSEVLHYFRIMGLKTSFGSGDRGFSVTVGGNAAASMSSAEWILKSMTNFQPTQREVDDARSALLTQLKSSDSNFSGSLAIGTASGLMKNGPYIYSRQQKIDLFLNDTWTVGRVLAGVRGARERVDVKIAAVGDFNVDQLGSFAHMVRALYPNVLTDEERIARKVRVDSIVEPLTYWRPFGSGKTDLDIGLARAFPGPKSGGREAAAFDVLFDEIGDAIFAENRIERKLGYVHRGHASQGHHRMWGFLYGGTDAKTSDELVFKTSQILTGWDLVLSKVKDGTLSPSNFVTTVQGTLRQRRLEPIQPIQVVSRLFEDTFRPEGTDSFAQMTEHFASLTAQEIYEIGQRYLFAPGVLNIVASTQAPSVDLCESHFSNPQEIFGRVGLK